MRLYPLATIPLALSLAAIVLSASTQGPQLYLTVGVAGATFLVSAAILFTYGRRSTEAKQIPLENFSLWADVGEPAAELKRLSLGDGIAAAHIASTDLASLAANAELLQSRSYMLVGRPGFESLLEEKIHRRVENVANDINAITKKINSTRGLSNELIPQIEQCAAQADRVANKFFELEGGKPEVIYLYLEPLRRATEKLSRDLRQASLNISKYLQWNVKAAPVAPKIGAPAPPKAEAQPAPKAEEPAPLKVEAPVVSKVEAILAARLQTPSLPPAELPSQPKTEAPAAPEVEAPASPAPSPEAPVPPKAEPADQPKPEQKSETPAGNSA